MSVSCVYIARYRSVRGTDHLSGEPLPCVACLNVIERPHRGGLDPVELASHVN